MFASFLISAHRTCAISLCVIGLLSVTIQACPYFTEFFADPVDVPDSDGEFIEIRLDTSNVRSDHDTLSVQFEDKEPLQFAVLNGKRLVLIHDTLICDKKSDVVCATMGSYSLPNTRETSWKLWLTSSKRERYCKDSVVLPVPKAGKSLQRVKESDKWEVSEATLGSANPSYESDVLDCALEPLKAEKDGLRWNLRFTLSGCDSSALSYRVHDLFGGQVVSDTVIMGAYWDIMKVEGRAMRVVASIGNDDYAANNNIDTIVAPLGESPLVITEVHHCPSEPEPEWVEVYNQTSEPLDLSNFRFCGRGSFWSGKIEAHQSILFTRDSMMLRDFLGFRDVEIRQISMGYLNNTSGSITLCYKDVAFDSVYWDKKTATCPHGFNPLTQKAENTPGYQSRLSGSTQNASQQNVPFSYKLSTRIVRPRITPLLVFVESREDVQLRLLDSAGHDRWSFLVPALSNAWWRVPTNDLPKTGVAYLSISAGKFENTIGIVLRP